MNYVLGNIVNRCLLQEMVMKIQIVVLVDSVKLSSLQNGMII